MKNAIRFAAHLALLLKKYGMIIDSQEINAIISSYIKLLQTEDKGSLVAMYYSYLPPETQLHGYSIFLQGIEQEKFEHFELGQKHNLDMLAISLHVVESIFTRGSVLDPVSLELPRIKFAGLDDFISLADTIQIKALEWVSFQVDQLPSLIEYASKLIRYFLSNLDI